MTLEVGISVLIWCLLAVGSWAGIILVIPWCQRTRFRIKLWRLRDRITDDFISGTLPINDATERLRGSVDVSIRYARFFTFANFALVYLVARKHTVLQTPPISHEGLSDDQLARLREYSHQLQREHVIHLLTGSLSGWVGCIILGIVAIPRLLAGGEIPTVAQRVPNEVADQPELWLIRSWRATDSKNERPLSAYI